MLENWQYKAAASVAIAPRAAAHALAVCQPGLAPHKAPFPDLPGLLSPWASDLRLFAAARHQSRQNFKPHAPSGRHRFPSLTAPNVPRPAAELLSEPLSDTATQCLAPFTQLVGTITPWSARARAPHGQPVGPFASGPEHVSHGEHERFRAASSS